MLVDAIIFKLKLTCMKKIIIYAMLLFVTLSSFSQQINPIQPLTRQDYLKKSKNQKTAAWVLLGGLPVLTGTGLLIGNRKEASFNDAFTGAVIAGIGVLSAIGSIPLFIASGRNKRKAMNASTYFKIEKTQTIQQTGISFPSLPAISIKLNL